MNEDVEYDYTRKCRRQDGEDGYEIGKNPDHYSEGSTETCFASVPSSRVVSWIKGQSG